MDRNDGFANNAPYALRPTLELVKDTITAHSKLGDKAAGDLAVHVWTRWIHPREGALSNSPAMVRHS